jgi:hypothetical protein
VDAGSRRENATKQASESASPYFATRIFCLVAIGGIKAAWCDGPPYSYHCGLKQAEAHLAAHGAPEPDMPPYDESKFEPLPDVEINPKDQYWFDPDSSD